MTDPMADRCPALAPSDVLPLSPRIPGLSPSELRRCVLYLGHDGDHYAQNSRSWSDPPWRLDVPVVPEHITCLREEQTGRLFVLAGSVWLRWVDDAVASGRLRRTLLLGELSDLAPLVEHPDPRKATT